VVGRRERTGDAEVGELHLPVRPAEDVLRLDVAVHELLGVSGFERRAELDPDRDHFRRRQLPPAPELVGERAALHVLHHDVEAPLAVPDVIDLDDVRVHEPGREPRLAQEAVAKRLVPGEVLGQHLERDRPVELPISGEIDGCHAAAAERPLDQKALGDGATAHTRLRHGAARHA